SVVAWHDQQGTPVPWPDRPRLMRLALARVESGESQHLRAALRWVIPQQYDPLRPPTAAELAARRGSIAADTTRPPISEPPSKEEQRAAAEEQERRDAAERERQGRLITAWERSNELQAKRVRKEAEDEVANNPYARAAGNPDRLVEHVYRQRVLQLIGDEHAA